MAVISLAIDIGGSYTSIYKKGFGLVLREPSLIAVSGKNGFYEIKAIGEEAKQMQGKTDDQTVVFSPIIDGELKSEEYATEMLKHFVGKVIEKSFFKKKIEAVVVVPCGATEEQKESYAKVCYNAKVSSVKLVPSVVVSALGGGKFVHTPTTYLIVDIGGSKTDIATVNLNSIIKGCTVGIGGKSMDIEIANAVNDVNQTIISLLTAEHLKEEIGSLFEKDTQNMEVLGVDSVSQAPKTTVVVSDVVKDAVLPLFERIAFAIEATLNASTPDISMDISRNGIFFSGGVSQIVGLEDYMRKRLHVPVHILPDGDVCAIMGAGKLLSDDKQLMNIIEEF